MPCVPLPPFPTPPPLPSGISLDPPIPTGSFPLNACCKLLAFDLKPPPVQLGVTLSPAIQLAINQALKGVRDYLNSLPLDCPRE